MTIYITDPVTHKETICDHLNGKCETDSIEELEAPHIFIEPGDAKPNGKFVCLRVKEDEPGTDADCDVIDLGTKMLDGLQVRGQRIVRNISPPKENEGFVHEEEIWYSPDLELPLIDIRREWSGVVITMQFTNVRRDEPNPSLFSVRQ